MLSGIARRVLAGTMPFGADLQPAISLLVTPVVAAVTVGAALIPSRRASRINPVVALRQD